MNIKHFTMAFAVIALIAGCKKESDGGSPTPTNVSNPVREWCDANLLAATQTFTVDATAGGTITGNGGTQVVFQPGGLVTSGGIPVSGMVQVELVEVLDIADMILMNKQALGDDNGTLKMLKSGGEVKITATQGGSELGLASDGAMVRLPVNGPDPAMEVFYGAEDVDGSVIWTSSGSTVSSVDTFYYDLTVDSLEWINCDDFPGAIGTTCNMNAAQPGYDMTNTMVWMVVPAFNAILGCWYDEINSRFTVQGVPDGYSAIIVALAEIGSSYHSSFTPITITTGSVPGITFSPTTLAQFELDVEGL